MPTPRKAAGMLSRSKTLKAFLLGRIGERYAVTNVRRRGEDRNIGNSMPRKMFPIVRVIFKFHEYHTMLYNRDEKETHETTGN